MSENPTGTANILHQHSEYMDLKETYSAQTANELTAASLCRHQVQASPDEVAAWNKINQAAVVGKMNIPAERASAEAKAKAVAVDIIETASAQQPGTVVGDGEGAADDAWRIPILELDDE